MDHLLAVQPADPAHRVAEQHLKTCIRHRIAGTNQHRVSGKLGRYVGHVTRRVWNGLALTKAREKGPK